MRQPQQPIVILLIGNPGTGKTWVLTSIIKQFKCLKRMKYGTIYVHSSTDVVAVGKYDGTMFQGTDRLSRAVMKDYDRFIAEMNDKYVILEGDRFMNTKVIEHSCSPFIIKITGDGSNGRQRRESKQTEQHLKRMATRNNNITAHIEVAGSEEALNYISAIINKL